jgi:hypothetical protein
MWFLKNLHEFQRFRFSFFYDNEYRDFSDQIHPTHARYFEANGQVILGVTLEDFLLYCIENQGFLFLQHQKGEHVYH